MEDLRKDEDKLVSEIMQKVNLSKDREVLEKHVVNLSKSVVNLSKTANINLGNKKARVIVVLDYSGSMRKMYNDGTVQQTINKLVPLGLKFDDNGTIDTYVFRDDFIKLRDLNLGNYENYVMEEIQKKVDRFGRTVYSPVLCDINKNICSKSFLKTILDFFAKLFSKQKEDCDTTFVLFITDGGNETGDNKKCDEAIKMLSYNKCFVQFIGIGSDKFRYFERLPKIKDRKSNNTGSTIINDLNNIGDTELYNIILAEFARWLKEMED